MQQRKYVQTTFPITVTPLHAYVSGCSFILARPLHCFRVRLYICEEDEYLWDSSFLYIFKFSFQFFQAKKCFLCFGFLLIFDRRSPFMLTAMYIIIFVSAYIYQNIQCNWCELFSQFIQISKLGTYTTCEIVH